MLFNSYSFMFAFLPAVWILYALALRVSWRLASPVLALASLFFYGWWDARFLPLLAGSILFNFLVGRRLERAAARPALRRFWLSVGIGADLALLGFFKYANFLLENAAALGGWQSEALNVILPVGISFFTFQQIAYLADVARGDCERYRLTDYTVFVAFFPQLIAGPIVHHREMMPQFARRRTIRAEHLALGLSIFVAGLFKKVVIADNLAQFATPVFAAADAGDPVTMAEAWGGALAYTFQIYFDFSGYSDMAIGLARMFGVRLPINFDSPYKSRSIIEFWRRWHMTLSRFLRDYLYIPLGGSRKGRPRRYANLTATMVLGGLWHGAGWGFVIWGALHGAYLAVNHAARAIPGAAGRALARVMAAPGAAVALTFAAVVFSWVFFRATTLDGALAMIRAMAGLDGATLPADYAARLGALPERLGLSYAHESRIGLRDWALTGVPFILVAAGIAWTMPNTNQIFLSGDRFYPQVPPPGLPDLPGAAPAAPGGVLAWRPAPAVAVLFAALFAASLLYASTISEFLYFQF